jgi:hypothetical protein
LTKSNKSENSTFKAEEHLTKSNKSENSTFKAEEEEEEKRILVLYFDYSLNYSIITTVSDTLN